MVNFGVAGYPPAFFESKYKKKRSSIFNWLSDLGLNAFEAQMTYGPRTKKETCLEFKSLAEEFNINISIHASYFIVLTTNDREKIIRSIDTLKRTFDLADLMGSDKIILHPGPLYEELTDAPLSRCIENLLEFFETIGDSSINLYLETAGKRGQLGSVEDIFKVIKEVKYCSPCIDFGHVHARTGGTLASNQGIDELFNRLKQLGAFDEDKKIHFHYTPIHYGPKGEISHRALADIIEEPKQIKLDLFEDNKLKDNRFHPRFERIVENLVRIDKDFTVISEANDSQEIAAGAMSKYFKELVLQNG